MVEEMRRVMAPVIFLSEDISDIPLPKTLFTTDTYIDGHLAIGDQIIFVILKQNLENNKEFEKDDIYPIAVLAEVLDFTKNNLLCYIETEILQRVCIESLGRKGKQVHAEAFYFNFNSMSKDLATRIKSTKQELLKYEMFLSPECIDRLQAYEEPDDIAYIIGDYFVEHKTQRLFLLQSNDSKKYWELVISKVLQTADHALTSKGHHKLKQVKRKPTVTSDTKKAISLPDKVKLIPIYQEFKETIDRDLKKMEELPSHATEYHNLVDYFSWLTAIPWGIKHTSQLDLDILEHKLNTSHYGLGEVKQNIIEYFCASQLRDQSDGHTLCFVGPPGTGKTSIAKSIAAAAGRPVVQLALGGVKDEVEFRGFRRTYIGSRPGRIITGLCNTKSMNPVIILDEIEKMQDSHKGSPEHALLEILDAQQNNKFIDRYIDYPVDLSDVLFICTSNDIDLVYPALKDRMEIIEFRSYTKDEKKIITKEFLIPKIRKEFNKAQDYEIYFDEELVEFIVDRYAIRDLERKLKRLYRASLTTIYRGAATTVTIDKDLFNSIYLNEKPIKESTIGF